MEERALCTLMCAAYSPLYSAAHAQSTGNVPDISALLSVFSGTMPHARCASHRNGAVHDMVQPPLQSPAVHPHGTASQIETRDHMRIDHKAASGIVNNLIRYQKAGIGGSHDADQHVCCCTAGSQNTAGPIHTAYSYRAGGVQTECTAKLGCQFAQPLPRIHQARQTCIVQTHTLQAIAAPAALFHIIEQRVTGCGVVNGGDPGQLAIDKVLERQERLDFSVKLRLFPPF